MGKQISGSHGADKAPQNQKPPFLRIMGFFGRSVGRGTESLISGSPCTALDTLISIFAFGVAGANLLSSTPASAQSTASVNTMTEGALLVEIAYLRQALDQKREQLYQDALNAGEEAGVSSTNNGIKYVIARSHESYAEAVNAYKSYREEITKLVSRADQVLKELKKRPKFRHIRLQNYRAIYLESFMVQFHVVPSDETLTSPDYPRTSIDPAHMQRPFPKSDSSDFLEGLTGAVKDLVLLPVRTAQILISLVSESDNGRQGVPIEKIRLTFAVNYELKQILVETVCNRTKMQTISDIYNGATPQPDSFEAETLRRFSEEHGLLPRDEKDPVADWKAFRRAGEELEKIHKRNSVLLNRAKALARAAYIQIDQGTLDYLLHFDDRKPGASHGRPH